MTPRGTRFLLIGLVAISVAVAARTAMATSSLGAAHVVSISGDPTDSGPINFYAPPPVLSGQGTVLSRAFIGDTGTSNMMQILVGGNVRPLDKLAAVGDAVDGSLIVNFDRVLFGAHGWTVFRTPVGTGIAATDPGSPFNVVAGIGASGPPAAIVPREVVSSGEWIATLEENPGFELIKLKTLAPFLDPNGVIDVLEVGDQVAGMPVTGFVADSLSLNPSGTGLVRVRRNGTSSEALVRFNALTGASKEIFVAGDQAPGFAPGVNIFSINSAPTINAAGDYAVKVRVLGPGIPGIDEVLYLFNDADQLIGFVREETQIPGAAANEVFSNIATPYVSGTGAFFIYQHLLQDSTRLRALGMIDMEGEFHTIGRAGLPAPGGGTYGEFAPNTFALNSNDLLVYRAEVVGIGFNYFGLDTTHPEAQPYRIIGPGDPVADKTVQGLGTIPQSGGADGRPTSLNDTQFVVTTGFTNGLVAILLINAVEIVAQPTSTASFTATATLSPTPTASRSPTNTPSRTASPTPSRTPTTTLTQTMAPTPTNTRDDVPLLTPTSTSTGTSTPTRTPTRTPTSTPDTRDFGDAPDQIEIPGRPFARYPTRLVNDGARHIVVDGFFLGQRVDVEDDGQPNETATGDDQGGPANDEEGVTFVTDLLPGETARVRVVASLRGFLDAWIDFNADGDWEDLGERLLDDGEPSFELAQGANDVDFVVPEGATSGLTFARFRLSLDGGLEVTGEAPNGEVEDYRVSIGPLRGDANCDGVLTAADIAALATNLLEEMRSPCLLDDLNGDGRLDIADVDALIRLLFEL